MKVYTPERTERMKRRAWAALLLAAGAMICALAACVLLCASARTLTATRNAGIAIAVWTLCGWAAILALNLGYRPFSAEYRHAVGLLKSPEQTLTGRVLSKGAVFKIPRSIEVARVRVVTSDGEVTLNIISRALKYVPAVGETAAFTTARGYITEVRDDGA